MTLPSEWSAGFLRGIIDGAPEGIVICAAGAADRALLYANAAFERLTGYAATELLGTDLRRLQGEDRGQEGRQRLRLALEQQTGARAVLRNYRKDGSPFWHEVLIEPIRDAAGVVTHYAGFHRDVGEFPRAPGTRAAAGMPAWLREDRLTGLHTRGYFEELLRHDWQDAMREQRTLSVLMFDFVALGAYNDTFGRQAGDACIRRLAGVISACFRRGSDLVARWDGGTLVALARNAEAAGLEAFAHMITQRVLGQRIHHPRCAPGKYVAMSACVATLLPSAKLQPENLLRGAERALQRARADRSGRIVRAGAKDFT
ncbi:MAG: diguanylate cyclase [Gammaproteobacteria bacterium]|nr:diguanylate cyclase [Gammaproteobacteria bacterium]MDE2252046.1 diguanylate cyclase [Gammaproteobacteria bacterium]